MANRIFGSLFFLFFGAVIVSSCCEPRVKNSSPFVLENTYFDTAIRDRYPNPSPGVLSPDSGYYPIYKLSIKNTGSEADTFALRFIRHGFGFTTSQYVMPGQTVQFATPGPIPDSAIPDSRFIYYSFFVSTPDSITISKERPDLTLFYGSVYNGPEACNTAANQVAINIDALHH
jgi:hypothetical protein